MSSLVQLWEAVVTLQDMLSNMDLPSERKKVRDRQDVLWLLRNLGIRNSEHEHHDAALTILKALAKGG